MKRGGHISDVSQLSPIVVGSVPLRGKVGINYQEIGMMLSGMPKKTEPHQSVDSMNMKVAATQNQKLYTMMEEVHAMLKHQKA